jgi:hypothetical protein
MDNAGHKAKRIRIEEPQADEKGAAEAEVVVAPSGRAQLLLSCPKLQTRLGKKYCDESELVPLLISHGLMRRVRTIQVGVLPLGGDSFTVTLDASRPSVGEAKSEIARLQGTSEDRQQLYKVATRGDGSAVREDDAEPEPLEDDTKELADEEIVTMAVKEEALMWRTYAKDHVTLSEDQTVASTTQRHDTNPESHRLGDEGDSATWLLVTSGLALTEGKHFWEVELLSEDMGGIFLGVTRPNLNPIGFYGTKDCNNAWLIYAYGGDLCGNGLYGDDEAGGYELGDRLGMLLDLNDGFLRFFKNGVPHGPGFPAGSVTGPVVPALHMPNDVAQRIRLLPFTKPPQ